ncbi:hypothetical protein BP00DRAFT_161971 [Aspergillus indologenus CBS 114.80]|uniref:Uncharacterized protein n=1 Tax=Aspergillus indologenus CBS 114.80 TaxID=1450541 RepID=A0A2V5ID19_9EURO|nr:hypothetical protein BP00DRAFT_161971 [Aspergillus indologenus CBS 114.80]
MYVLYSVLYSVLFPVLDTTTYAWNNGNFYLGCQQRPSPHQDNLDNLKEKSRTQAKNIPAHQRFVECQVVNNNNNNNSNNVADQPRFEDRRSRLTGLKQAWL